MKVCMKDVASKTGAIGVVWYGEMEYVKRTALRWFGHLERMKSEEFVKKIKLKVRVREESHF